MYVCMYVSMQVDLLLQTDAPSDNSQGPIFVSSRAGDQLSLPHPSSSPFVLHQTHVHNRSDILIRFQHLLTQTHTHAHMHAWMRKLSSPYALEVINCMYVCMYVRTKECVRSKYSKLEYICMYVCMYMCICVYMYLVWILMYICKYVCLCMYLCIRMNVS